MLAGWSEPLASNWMDDNPLLDREPLGFVHGECRARNYWKLDPHHSGAIFDCGYRQNGHPLRLIFVERWPAVWELADERFWKSANSTWSVNNAKKLPTRAVGESKQAGHILSEYWYVRVDFY